MEILKFKLTGITPLLMHNNVATDPLHPLAKALKKISGIRTKTDEHHQEMAWIEYQSGIYHDEKLGPYIPGRCFDSMVRDAAKLTKKGTTVKRALQTMTDKCALIYDGPRDIEKLYKKGFFDRRPVGVNNSTVIRTRPCFSDWQVEVAVAFEATQLDRSEVIGFFETAGKMIGLCDYRPTYGKFTAEVI